MKIAISQFVFSIRKLRTSKLVWERREQIVTEIITYKLVTLNSHYGYSFHFALKTFYNFSGFDESLVPNSLKTIGGMDS